jgi:EAL domain-containing protein (putative c-di-GMP-specific phosphodiesterase class I)
MPGAAGLMRRTSAVSLLLDDLIDRSGFDVWVAVGTSEDVPVVLGTTHHATAFGFDETVPAWAWQLSATVAREGTAVVLPHLDEVPTERRRFVAGVRSGAQGVVGVPIRTPDQRPLGVLCGLSRSCPDPGLDAVVPHAEVVARVIGTVIAHESEIARLSWRLDDLDDVDTLTPDRAARATTSRSIDQQLETVRVHLGMDQVVVGRFSDDRLHIVNAATAFGVRSLAGFSEPDEGSLARLVADGEVPAAIADVTRVPALASVRVILDLQMRSHLGVPLRRPDGTVVGVLCAISHQVREDLGVREIATLNALGQQLVGSLAEQDRSQIEDRAFARDLRDLLGRGGPQIVYQPVVALAELKHAGVEALSRFAGSPRPPDQWFARATRTGHGPELELRAVRSALRGLSYAPGFLSLNVSPSTIVLPDFTAGLADQPLDRLVLEITEHTQVSDYGVLSEVLAPLRAAGLRIAVDDVGAGFASMRHVLVLAPELIKLDLSLVRGISHDVRRQSLAAALLTFAADLGASVVAEGVETAGELDCLRELGVHFGQGFHLGRPEPLRDPQAA